MMTGHWNRRDFVKGAALQVGAVSAGLAGQTSPEPAPPPLVTFRVQGTYWQTDERLQALLDFFARQPGAVDEVAFAVNFFGQAMAPLSADGMNARAERLRTVLAELRKHGIGAGLNVGVTIGHSDRGAKYAGPWQPLVDPRGRECRAAYCPSHADFLNYLRQAFTVLAGSRPDFMWVDDDIRLATHSPATFTCFCDLCLRKFSEQAGSSFTRESLRAAFDTGPLESRLAMRRKWLEYNRQRIAAILGLVQETVHKVKPDVSLGFMTGDRFYEGYDFAGWAKALMGPGRVPARFRPGGAFYSDEVLLELVEKAHMTGRQASALPSEVRIIESEIENLPRERLRKSNHTTVVEAAAHMAAGNTGTTFNVLPNYENRDEALPLLLKIGQYREFYKAVQAAQGRDPAKGVWPAWNRDLFATAFLDDEWLAAGKVPDTEPYVLREPYILGEIGIPLCYQPDGSAVAALCGAAVLAFTKEELRRMFSGGVLMDAGAWFQLKRLELENWTGVRAVENAVENTPGTPSWSNVSAAEVLTAHPLNGEFAGWSRQCRSKYKSENAYRLVPQSDSVEVLARVSGAGSKELGPCMTAFQNELGGRVVVAGYYPWTQIHSAAKASQMKAVCGWLSRDRLPVVAETHAKVVLWCREDSRRNKTIVALNASLDPIQRLSLRVLTSETRFTHLAAGGKPRSVSGVPIASHRGHVRVILPDIAAWSIHLVLNRRV